MKVLHIALLSPGEPNAGISRAFEDHGYEVYTIDWLPLMKQKGVAGLRSHVLQVAGEFKPQLIFMQLQTPDVIDAHTAATLKKHSFVVNWTGDVRENIDWYLQLAPHVDVTLFTNMHDVERMRLSGMEAGYLQIGYDDTIYKSLGIRQKNNQVVFMGNNYAGSHLNFPKSQERADMVSMLYKRFPKNFQAYGSGWANTRHLGPMEENKIYQTCAIAINQNHFDLPMFSSDRILRAMASGAFCLTKHYEGIEKEFKPGIHLATFEGLEDLPIAIEYWLQNPVAREIIAENGCKLVQKNYNWFYRIEQLMDVCRDHDYQYKLEDIEEWHPKAFQSRLMHIPAWKNTYSQIKEECYLSYIAKAVGIKEPGFIVDIGAGDGFSCSNSRRFLQRGWKHILLDGDPRGCADVHQAWITGENIMDLLDQYKCPDVPDILSIDLDGNDYWLLEKILARYIPRIIIVEINPIFKREEAYAIAYNPEHTWKDNDYYGASLGAFEKLCKGKDYDLVFVSNSLNAYFVHKSLMEPGHFQFTYQVKHDHPSGEGEWVAV